MRLLYNEQVLAIPGCPPIGAATTQDPGAALDCDLEDFLAATAAAAGDAATMDKWCDLDDDAMSASSSSTTTAMM